jgi:flagellar hook assembly protein FlgD
VYVRYTDGSGNPSTSFSDSITLDTTAPVVSGVSDAPDPFKHHRGETTTINFTVADNLAGTCTVALNIFNSSGALVKTFIMAEVSCPSSGAKNSVTWDGRNNLGDLVPPGTYTYRVRAIDKALNPSIVQSGKTTVR